MILTADIGARRDELRRRFPVWRPRTLSDWLDDCAERYGGRPMVLTDDDELSYADVATESCRLADGLAALGVKPGDRVAMIMANYAEFVAIKFAIARTGAIAVPLNYLYRGDELRFVLADAGCRVVITMTGFADLDYPATLDVMPHPPIAVLLDTDGRASSGALMTQSVKCSRWGSRTNAGARSAVSWSFRLPGPCSLRPMCWPPAAPNSQGSRSPNAWCSTVRTICRPRRRAKCRNFVSCNGSVPPADPAKNLTGNRKW